MTRTCGVCGKSGAFIGGGPCALCSRWICLSHPLQTTAINQNVVAHIMNNAPSSVEKTQLMLLTRSGTVPIYSVNVCLSCFTWVDYWGKVLHRYHQDANRKHFTQQCLENAERFERAGRFEDAAKEYEKAEAWDDAGRVRRESSTHVVKTVNVDLNRLMDDLRRGGLALNYKCHSCGGGITIGSGGMEAPKFCPYCGVMVDSKTLSDLLRTALR